MKYRICFCVLVVVLSLAIVSSSEVQAQEIGDPVVEGIVEIMARQVTQLPQGVYDADANRTFVVFPGCGGQTPCTVDPYIVFYEHSVGAWSTPLQVGTSPPRHDAHFYPQVVVDDEHYLHVFNGGHLDPLQHYKSVVPTDYADILAPENWQDVAFANSQNQDRATYPMVFKTQTGVIYLLYRQSFGGSPDWYEPIYYIKSQDNAATWSMPQKLIDPGGLERTDGGCDGNTHDDGWDTIYIKSVYHQEAVDRLHLTFENHKAHNLYEDKLFYVVFDFGDEHLYAPNGDALGPCVNQYEFENPAHKMQLVSTGEQEFSETMSAVGVDARGQPNVFYTTMENEGKITIDWVTWQTDTWSLPVHLFWDDAFDTRPMGVEFYCDNSFDFYVERGTFDLSLIELVRWHYNNHPLDPQWSGLVLQNNTEQDGYSDFAFVTDHHPDVKATFVEGEYTIWSDPLPTGELYAMSAADPRLFSITGQVTDLYGTPFDNVTVQANAGALTATTDISGHFALSCVPSGTYTLRPELAGYGFTPPTRTLHLPPQSGPQDFTLLPSPVTVALTLGTTGTVNLPAHLVYTDTRGRSTSLRVPAGVVSREMVLEMRPISVTADLPLVFAGHAFDLRAYAQSSLLSQLTFNDPAILSLQYSAADLHLGRPVDESSLALYMWTGEGWREHQTCPPESTWFYGHDLEQNVLSGPICQTGRYALLAKERWLYLPLIIRGL